MPLAPPVLTPASLPCPACPCVPTQPCVFKVDYVVEVAGNKEFGSVFLQQGGQQENVALSVVQNGWAKVGLPSWLVLGCNSSKDSQQPHAYRASLTWLTKKRRKAVGRGPE